MEAMVDGDSEDELRRRGLDLQAALPEPRGWLARRRKRSEGSELAEGVAHLTIGEGLWALLIAVPGVILWILRRHRHKTR